MCKEMPVIPVNKVVDPKRIIRKNDFSKTLFPPFFRIYANNRTCARCLLEIQASDLVMKARHCLFHVECFRYPFPASLHFA
jgi:hypothetical protein